MFADWFILLKIVLKTQKRDNKWWSKQIIQENVPK